MRWETKPQQHNLGIRQGHPLAQGLVGYWPMWEGGGTRILDVSGKGLHGTFSGVDGNSWVQSAVGSGVDFADEGDRIAVGTVSSLNFTVVQPFTFWALATGMSTPEFSAFIARRSSSAGYQYHFRVLSTRTLSLLCTSGSISGTVGAVPASGLYQACVTQDGTTTRFFVDGAGAGSGGSKGMTDIGVVPTIGGATDVAQTKFGEPIYAVAAWSRALTNSEVKGLADDPWSLITPRKRTYFFAVASGGTPAVSAVPRFMAIYRRRRAA